MNIKCHKMAVGGVIMASCALMGGGGQPEPLKQKTSPRRYFPHTAKMVAPQKVTTFEPILFGKLALHRL